MTLTALADRARWTLDDSGDEATTSEGEGEVEGTEKEMKKKTVFKPSHKAPTHRPPPGTLPLPVILPQRRPGSRRRGFVRAYAPLLKASGVTEEDLAAFNEGLSEAMKVQIV